MLRELTTGLRRRVARAIGAAGSLLRSVGTEMVAGACPRRMCLRRATWGLFRFRGSPHPLGLEFVGEKLCRRHAEECAVVENHRHDSHGYVFAFPLEIR